jgi:ParB family chromosome partitioning protein
MCAKKANPYLDIDDISKDIDEAPESMPRRPQTRSRPLVGGSTTPVTRSMDRSKAAEADAKIASLEEEVRRLTELANSSLQFMPVTKQEIRGKYLMIDVELIDILPENMRAQEMLDEAAVADILPLFRQLRRQTQPGILRPKADGRYEVVDGSRRFYCVRLLGIKYFYAWVGEVPDADVALLSKVANLTRTISELEIAIYYNNMLLNGLYKSWYELGQKLNVPKTSCSVYKALIDLPAEIKIAHSNPNEVSKNLALYWRGISSKHPDIVDPVLVSLDEILEAKKAAIANSAETPSASFITTFIKKKVLSFLGVSNVEPEFYKGKNGGKIKRTVTKSGGVKLELMGFSSDETERIIATIKGII